VTATPLLKDLLGRGKPVWIMGAHDVVSAKIVEDAGFDAVGIQSLQLAMVDGLPDIGLITPDYVVDLCRRVRRAVDIPIVVDFEQGFGEPYAAVHWMKEFEAAGVSAVHIDDYGLPYKCTFFPPHTMGLESVDETAAKIRAMVSERSNPDFMVIGRPGTYVATVHDTEEERRRDWLVRAERYLEAGSDALFAICPTVESAKYFRQVVDAPLMTIRTLGTEMHDEIFHYEEPIVGLSIDDIYRLGYEMFIEPTTLLGPAINAMAAAAAAVKASGRSDSVSEEHGELQELLTRWADAATLARFTRQYYADA